MIDTNLQDKNLLISYLLKIGFVFSIETNYSKCYNLIKDNIFEYKIFFGNSKSNRIRLDKYRIYVESNHLFEKKKKLNRIKIIVTYKGVTSFINEEFKIEMRKAKIQSILDND